MGGTFTVWPHYSVIHEKDGMEALRRIFPTCQPDSMNFALFSTSGVHGSYQTIEDSEEHIASPSDETFADLTFLIVHPRLVVLRYGNCEPKSAEDIAWLKLLRKRSWAAARKIGAADKPVSE